MQFRSARIQKIAVVAAASAAALAVALPSPRAHAAPAYTYLIVDLPRITVVAKPVPAVDLIQFADRVRLRGSHLQKMHGEVQVYRWNRKPHAPQVGERIWGTQDFPEPGHDKTFRYEKTCIVGRWFSRWHYYGWAEGHYSELTDFFPHAKGDIHKAPDRAESKEITCSG